MFKGLLCVIGASVIFGITPSIAKQLLNNGLSPIVLIFWYSAISALLNAATARLERRSLRATPRATMQLLGVGLISGATSLLLNSSYNYIPAGVATTIHFLYPTVTAVAMALFFGQRFTRARALAVLFSLAGMFCVAGIKASASLAGYALALGSAVTYAAYLMAMGRLHFDGLHSTGRLFWSNLCVAVVMGGLLLFQRQGALVPDWKGAGAIALNCILMFVAYRLLLYGIGYLGATTTAFTSMAEPITSLIVSKLLYPEDKITLVNLLGVVLILSAMLLATVQRKQVPVGENI